MITDASITPGNPASTSSNSVEIPLTFADGSGGCSNSTIVTTESEFGIELLMPELAKLSCANDPTTAVSPINTATDGLQAVTDLAATGSLTQIAFTEDPESAGQQAQLKGREVRSRYRWR